jgi:GT2 family glycosyltransferase
MNRLPLTYLFEPSRGKNAALNTGLASVEGDLVVLTDDDILPRFDWLREMRLAADSHASFSVFGGKVNLRWEIRPEEWILSWVKLGPVFALTDPSWEEGPVCPGYIFGGNMAIRAKVFEAGYRFCTSIGPQSGCYAMGSETELTMRLDKAGLNAWHCKKAVVEHIVQKSHMTQRWILSRGLKFGRERYRLEFQYEYANDKRYLGIPRHIIKEAAKKGIGIACAKLLGNRAKLVERRWAFNYLLGQIIEASLVQFPNWHTPRAIGLSRPASRKSNLRDAGQKQHSRPEEPVGVGN